MEKGWGGTAQQRMDKAYSAFARESGVNLPPAPPPVTLARLVDAEARAATVEPAAPVTDAVVPREDPLPSSLGSPT